MHISNLGSLLTYWLTLLLPAMTSVIFTGHCHQRLQSIGVCQYVPACPGFLMQVLKGGKCILYHCFRIKSPLICDM